MEITFGQKIRELRNKHDLSLRELAESVGISAPFLSDIELGKRFPSNEVLGMLATKLKTKVDELKSHDQRPPTEDIKARIAKDPSYGFLLRKLVDIPSDELKAFLKKRRL